MSPQTERKKIITDLNAVLQYPYENVRICKARQGMGGWGGISKCKCNVRTSSGRKIYIKTFPSLATPLPATTAPKPIANNTNTPGTTPRNDPAPFARPLLVLLRESLLLPLCPFDVANTDGSMVTVLCVLVTAVVENVCGFWGVTSEKALSVRKTRAKPGAGTWTWHVLAFVSQVTVLTSRLPVKRPSDSKVEPKVFLNRMSAIRQLDDNSVILPDQPRSYYVSPTQMAPQGTFTPTHQIHNTHTYTQQTGLT